MELALYITVSLFRPNFLRDVPVSACGLGYRVLLRDDELRYGHNESLREVIEAERYCEKYSGHLDWLFELYYAIERR
jgi:hypothetical protein